MFIYVIPVLQIVFVAYTILKIMKINFFLSISNWRFFIIPKILYVVLQHYE